MKHKVMLLVYGFDCMIGGVDEEHALVNESLHGSKLACFFSGRKHVKSVKGVGGGDGASGS